MKHFWFFCLLKIYIYEKSARQKTDSSYRGFSPCWVLIRSSKIYCTSALPYRLLSWKNRTHFVLIFFIIIQRIGFQRALSFSTDSTRFSWIQNASSGFNSIQTDSSEWNWVLSKPYVWESTTSSVKFIISFTLTMGHYIYQVKSGFPDWKLASWFYSRNMDKGRLQRRI